MKKTILSLSLAVLISTLCFSGGTGEKPAAVSERDSFPDKPIYLIVGAGPGGGTDIPARALAASAPEFLNNQPVIVVNKPGSNEMVASKYVLSQKPDGYTLLVGWGNVSFTFARHVYDLPIDVFKDFKPVIGLISYSSCLAVPMDSPFKTVADLVQFAKANPGALKWTHTGRGGTHWALAMDFFRKAGISLTEVPNSEGGAAVRNLVAGGKVDVAVMATFLGSSLHNQRLRVLAVGFPERDAILPDVPTMKESGYDLIAAYDIKPIAGPAGMEDWKVQKLYEGFKKAIEHSSFKTIVKNANMTVLGWNPQETLDKVMAFDKEFESFAKEIKDKVK